ncbi:MAG: TetR/AcrR family transcriptional regulator [Limosilactobacillus sp.]
MPKIKKEKYTTGELSTSLQILESVVIFLSTNPQVRKTDRRTTYTINLIKECFLELIQQMPYSQITVTKLCRTADLSRSTFYLHFNTITDVLNAVLDDALLAVPESNFAGDQQDLSIDYLKKNESLIPACQRVGSSGKYRKLLLDPDLSEYIVGRIMVHERDKVIPSIKHKTGLSTQDAETLFLYILHGSFAVNRANHFNKNDEWYHQVQLLNRFTDGGYQSLKY